MKHLKHPQQLKPIHQRPQQQLKMKLTGSSSSSVLSLQSSQLQLPSFSLCFFWWDSFTLFAALGLGLSEQLLDDEATFTWSTQLVLGATPTADAPRQTREQLQLRSTRRLVAFDGPFKSFLHQSKDGLKTR